MPEVVYPTPYPNSGRKRNWTQVFPIWKVEGDPDFSFINEILEGIAMNNRMGGKTPDELKAKMIVDVRTHYGVNIRNVKLPLNQRTESFAQLGRYLWYIDEVFANLGGAYREYK